MFQRVLRSALRRGVEEAVNATAESAVTATTRAFNQVFVVTLPVTVYVKASYCEVTVLHQSGTQVEVAANLRAAFGWDLLSTQDEFGVYIIAKRKLVVGAFSTGHFTLTVPPEANLVCDLTPGAIRFANIHGKLTIPGRALSIVPVKTRSLRRRSPDSDNGR